MKDTNTLLELHAELRQLLLDWQQWEADIIGDAQCWLGDSSPYPIIYLLYLERLTPMQEKRTELLTRLALEAV